MCLFVSWPASSSAYKGSIDVLHTCVYHYLFLCSSAGGTVAVFVSPLEVLKTRLQTQKVVKGVVPKYKGGIHVYGKTQPLLTIHHAQNHAPV